LRAPTLSRLAVELVLIGRDLAIRIAAEVELLAHVNDGARLTDEPHLGRPVRHPTAGAPLDVGRGLDVPPPDGAGCGPLDAKEGTPGYNAQTDEYEDLVKAGVIDPTKDTRTALQNAASVAGLLLTTECVVVEKKEEKPSPAGPPGGGMGGMY
jgi:hypothetical protein